MLVLWSLVRNNVVLAVYLLFSVACFFTVHEHYLAASSMSVTITGGSIANVLMSMTVDSRTYNGTVSGIIRNNAGQAVAGCFVGLYQVKKVGDITQETLVSVTKTNDAGKYLFDGVNGGQYLVKAKLER